MEQIDIESLKAARRRRIAEEIQDALKASRMNRKEFAQAMGRQPSEVTKWLSGNHNFTCDMLEELSAVLGTSISGTRDPSINKTVAGYRSSSSGGSLREPSGSTLIVEMPSDAMERLKAKAAKGAMTLREYVKKVLYDKLDEKEYSVMDLCGSCPEFPSAEELRAERTDNAIHEI